ncbi:MAG TPA: hypothetical protein VNG33_10080 [Polyangiaceae bacterium]|nr:hypothetical protein [Polyangiaceae bacterium]
MKLASVLTIGTLFVTACGGAQPSTQAPTASGSAACPGAAQAGPGMMKGGGMMGGQGKDGAMKGGGMMGGGMMKGGGMMGGGMMGKGMGDSCPMAVAGTTVRAEEVAGGTSMVFTTTGDVAELRRRVSAMADMHNKHGAEGCPMMSMHEAPSDASPSPAPAATPPAESPVAPPSAAPAKPAAPQPRSKAKG